MFGEAERLPFLNNKDILHENLTNINEHIPTGNNNTVKFNNRKNASDKRILT